PLTEVDPEALVEQLLATKAHSQNAHQQEEALAHILDELTQRPQPEMEKFPIYYYDEGIDGLSLQLRTQQTVAIQHWQACASS
ncbi:MAG: hypothetical protein GY726_17385, partial [Proteobacteria bacterium]|nr:hypothetical protein [Pseudomonadota bacterium]